MIFLPQMDEVGFGTGASEQNINSCLKWSKGVQMGPKGCQHQLTPPYFDQLSERHQPLSNKMCIAQLRNNIDSLWTQMKQFRVDFGKTFGHLENIFKATSRQLWKTFAQL